MCNIKQLESYSRFLDLLPGRIDWIGVLAFTIFHLRKHLYETAVCVVLIRASGSRFSRDVTALAITQITAAILEDLM